MLLLGGARSGKSRMAQARAESMVGELVYLATGEARDAEMTARIARHQQDRGARWRTVEVPIDLADAMTRERGAGRVVLVDCLTLWLSNVLLGEANSSGGPNVGRDDGPDGRFDDRLDIERATERLLFALTHGVGTVLLVSNEVGLGIVPDNALARRFRDEAGRLHQRVAAIADEVLFVAAGLAVRMK